MSPAADPLKRIKNSLMLRVKDSKKSESQYAKSQDIYLTSNYGSDFDFEKLFQGIDDVLFIHDDYISEFRYLLSKKTKKKKTKKLFAQKNTLKKFFNKLEFSKFIVILGIGHPTRR